LFVNQEGERQGAGKELTLSACPFGAGELASEELGVVEIRPARI
jgi:hypothetical protein